MSMHIVATSLQDSVSQPSLDRYTLPHSRIITGRKAILRLQPLLVELARRSGQAGEADNLAHFLATPNAIRKTPHLLLIGSKSSFEPDSESSQPAGAGSIHEIVGAVLIFQHRTPFGRLPIYSTNDPSGRRCLIAPRENRARIAFLGAQRLLERGARVVHIAFNHTHHDADGIAPAAPLLPPARLPGSDERVGAGEWTLLQEPKPAYLSLSASFDQTLARINQRTRANLRYYRRRSEQELGCRFDPAVGLTREELLALNRRSTFPISDAHAEWRYDGLRTMNGPFLVGIRDRSGELIALAAGRRQHGFAELDWQMSRDDLHRYSLSTVLRSYLIEHEISLGSTRLYVDSGTPHQLGSSFVEELVGELILRRQTPWVGLFRQITRAALPEKSALRQTLDNPELSWQPW